MSSEIQKKIKFLDDRGCVGSIGNKETRQFYNFLVHNFERQAFGRRQDDYHKN